MALGGKYKTCVRFEKISGGRKRCARYKETPGRGLRGLRGVYRTCVRRKMTDAGWRCAEYKGPGEKPKGRRHRRARECIRMKKISGGRERCAKFRDIRR